MCSPNKIAAIYLTTVRLRRSLFAWPERKASRSVAGNAAWEGLAPLTLWGFIPKP